MIWSENNLFLFHKKYLGPTIRQMEITLSFGEFCLKTSMLTRGDVGRILYRSTISLAPETFSNNIYRCNMTSINCRLDLCSVGVWRWPQLRLNGSSVDAQEVGCHSQKKMNCMRSWCSQPAIMFVGGFLGAMRGQKGNEIINNKMAESMNSAGVKFRAKQVRQKTDSLAPTYWPVFLASVSG